MTFNPSIRRAGAAVALVAASVAAQATVIYDNFGPGTSAGPIGLIVQGPSVGTIADVDINASAAIAVTKLGTGRVTGSNNGTATSLTLWRGTAAQYAAIGTKDSNTVYVVVD